MNKQCNYLFNRLMNKPEYRAIISKTYELYIKLTDKCPDAILDLDKILSLTALKEFVENEAFYEAGFHIGKKKCKY